MNGWWMRCGPGFEGCIDGFGKIWCKIQVITRKYVHYPINNIWTVNFNVIITNNININIDIAMMTIDMIV